MSKIKQTNDDCRCPSCNFYDIESFDPSPAGVGLSPGTYQQEVCNHPDRNSEVWDEDWGHKKSCPVWQSIFRRLCARHGSYDERWNCGMCQDESEQQLADWGKTSKEEGEQEWADLEKA